MVTDRTLDVLYAVAGYAAVIGYQAALLGVLS